MATTLFPATVNLLPHIGQVVVIAIAAVVALTMLALTAKAWVR